MAKDIFLDLSESKGLGDTLCVTPVIRKLFECYEKKINIISNYPVLFQNNTYIDKNYSSGSINLNFVKGNIYKLPFKKNQFDSVVNLAAQAGVRYSIENPPGANGKREMTVALKPI